MSFCLAVKGLRNRLRTSKGLFFRIFSFPIICGESNIFTRNSTGVQINTLLFLYLQLFYFTHHLYVVWWTLLILHAPNFWKWFIAPAVIYLIERISRLSIVNKARFGKTVIKEGIIFPSNVRRKLDGFTLDGFTLNF